jgi:hypothetical protein
MLIRVVRGKSKPMRVDLCTGILRLRVPMMTFSFRAKRMF